MWLGMPFDVDLIPRNPLIGHDSNVVIALPQSKHKELLACGLLREHQPWEGHMVLCLLDLGGKVA